MMVLTGHVLTHSKMDYMTDNIFILYILFLLCITILDVYKAIHSYCRDLSLSLQNLAMVTKENKKSPPVRLLIFALKSYELIDGAIVKPST